MYILIPTHTTRHLAACLASLAHQTVLPSGVVVTCDNDSPEIGGLLAEWWPRVCAVAAVPIPLWHTFRPHQGKPHLNQVRNNGLRTLQQRAGANGSDLVIVLDGDTMLAPDAVALHGKARDDGADLIIPYRVMVSEAVTATIDAKDILIKGVPEYELLTVEEEELLAARQRRYQRHLFMRRLGLIKPQKPKIIGGHHSFTFALAARLNGFDEDYVGYRFNDDDFSRRANSLRPRASTRIAVDQIRAYHLHHPTRAPDRIQDAPGYARFMMRDLPTFAASGLSSPRAQPPVETRSVSCAPSTPAEELAVLPIARLT